MGIRRTHKKSRKGCLQCKQKHTKCDEKGPSCGNCIKFERECSFLHNRSSRSNSQTYDDSEDSPIPSGSIPSLPSLPSSILPREQELGLMNHWTASTCLTLARGPGNLHIWQTAIPSYAISYPFLLDGRFALTCAHMASIETDIVKKRQYVHAALEYQHRAVGPFKHTLENVTPESSHAAYASAIVTMILQFGLPGALAGLPDESIPDPKHTILETVHLLTGVGTISRLWRDHLTAGPLGGLFLRPSDEEVPAADLQGEEEQALRRLHSYISNNADIAQEDKELYSATLEMLRKAFYQYKTYEAMSSVMAWPVQASAILPLFTSGQTMALLIVMHWAVLLHSLNMKWWAKDSGRRLITALASDLKERTLGAELVASIEWAHHKVGLPVEHLHFATLRSGAGELQTRVYYFP